MSDEIKPANPDDEIAAYQSAQRPGAGGMTPDLASFLQAGQTVAVAAASASGLPISAMGIGCILSQTEPERCVARVFLSGGANPALLDCVRQGGSVGTTLTGVDHRSIQIKASRGAVVVPTPRELAELHRQVAAHREWLEIVGFTRAFAETLTEFADADVAAIAFEPERIYVQTPGPGAGSRLE